MKVRVELINDMLGREDLMRSATSKQLSIPDANDIYEILEKILREEEEKERGKKDRGEIQVVETQTFALE